ncbi:NACHT domain-containing NTPase [Microbacterium sp. W4I20]|uniref:NACHT domain-containing protein n=1 Tax=Microbacterium sp. W4I20 TaxID=3042262 RepID=UPI002780FC3E|nr:hypothetical protein [Microbacterium sp. W4I20]MDQ0729186.1 hypothetical protein [Microbacterium sp. W4I20]
MDYDFSSIGTDGFERMAQTLVVAALGNHVKPTGVGRDDGRDCYFNGPVSYSGVTGPWDGYGVVQVKHRARDSDTTTNRQWVRTQISSELKRWKPQHGKRRDKRARIPAYYLFVTGATLSPEGQDDCLAFLREKCAEIGIIDCDLWSRAEVSRHLDKEPGIRQTYLHIILPGDIVEAMRNGAGEQHALLAMHLSVGALRELGERQWARLSDSGLQSEERLRLTSVAVDLPCAREGTTDQSQGILRTAVALGERDLRPSESNQYTGILLKGGPGQGKSTIAQLLCQFYRSAFVEDSPALLPKQRELLKSTATAVSRLGLETPVRRRWPVYVDLSKFGDSLASDEGQSLLSYIASSTQIQGQTMHEADLIRWRNVWPWAVVLDGLDEVAHATIRERVSSAIDDFITDCRMSDANVLFLATTRPQGYHGELGGLDLDELSLHSLGPQQALEYGKLLASTRYDDDPIARNRIVERLEEASESALTSRLMSTPLQVTIMSTLLEQATRVPETRHALFDAYYSAIYSREQAKASRLGEILTKYRLVVDFLHEQVALYLHIQAQYAGRAESLLDSARLAQLIAYRLRLDEHDERDARRLADEIITAARNRVVLLVGKHDNLLGYEIRPIQEYFAARAITSGSEAEIYARIEKLIPGAHWRNTLLLAFGRLETHTNPQVPLALVSLCAQADSASPLSLEVGPGRRLALFLLADSFAANVPRLRRALLKQVLDVLAHWPDATIPQLQAVLSAEIEQDSTSRAIVQQALITAITGGSPSIAAACAVLVPWQRARQGRGTLANFVLAQDQRWRATPADVQVHVDAGGALRELISTNDLTPTERAVLENVLLRFGQWAYRSGVPLATLGAVTRQPLQTGPALPEEILRSDRVTGRLLDALNAILPPDGDLAQILREQLIAVKEGLPASANELIADSVLALLDAGSDR